MVMKWREVTDWSRRMKQQQETPVRQQVNIRDTKGPVSQLLLRSLR